MVAGRLLQLANAGRVIVCFALMASCAQIHNDPINVPLQTTGLPPSGELGAGVETYYDDTVVALSFSGGGTRAAAFSYGVLTGFDETQVPSSTRSRSLLDHVDFVTGVSGGSITAAYYGLKKRAAMADFKQRFLLRNPEQGLQMDL